MKKYIIIIEKAKDNYAAFCPDVLGCGATGSTVEKTLKEIKSALEFHLKDENELPEAHDLKYLLDHGELDLVTDEFYITRVAISLPQH